MGLNGLSGALVGGHRKATSPELPQVRKGCLIIGIGGIVADFSRITRF
ncbi:hypothetical protein [Methyloglobulus sp.]